MITIKTENYIKKISQQMVDMSTKPLVDNKLKSQLQKAVNAVLKPTFFDQIPLQQISDALKQMNVRLLQEDGTDFSGFLMGEKECGTPEASNQHTEFQLALGNQLLKCALMLSWCRMGSGKMEVIGYIA